MTDRVSPQRFHDTYHRRRILASLLLGRFGVLRRLRRSTLWIRRLVRCNTASMLVRDTYTYRRPGRLCWINKVDAGHTSWTFDLVCQRS